MAELGYLASFTATASYPPKLQEMHAIRQQETLKNVETQQPVNKKASASVKRSPQTTGQSVEQRLLSQETRCESDQLSRQR